MTDARGESRLAQVAPRLGGQWEKRGGQRPPAWIYRAADLNMTWRLLPEMSILPRSRCGHCKSPMGPAGAGPGRTNATDDIKKTNRKPRVFSFR